MDALTTIPVVGVVFQLIGYLVETVPVIAPVFVGLAAPIALGALCGIMNERSGIVNIGIEGMMLSSAFTGFLAAGLVAQAFGGGTPSPVFGATVPILLGVVVAVLTGMAVSALHAWLSISIRADQIISGTIINILAFGLTGYLNRLIITPNPRLGAGIFQPFHPPDALVNLPVVGWLFSAFLAHGPIAISVLFLAIFLQVMLFRSRWGLRTRAIGEHPKAAETVGIDVIAIRYRALLLAGLISGLAGSYLSLSTAGSFQMEMTAGKGYIALAAMIFGAWHPVGALGAALVFGFADTTQSLLSILGSSGSTVQVPPQLLNSVPYIVTIIVVAGVVGRVRGPASAGQPYEQG